MHSLSTYDASTRVPDTPITSDKNSHHPHISHTTLDVHDSNSDTESYMTSLTSGTAFLDAVTIHDPRLSIPPHLSILVSEQHYDGPIIR